MGYTPQTINPGDVAAANWANKVENFLAQFGNYLGVLATEDNLPASADVGDWYLVLDSRAIFVWDGSKWVKVGGGVMGYVQDELLVEIGGTYQISNSISGVVDGVNTSFVLDDAPIWPGSLLIVADGVQITDDGNGRLSDGGTVDYETGNVVLATPPLNAITAEYKQKMWDGVRWQAIGIASDGPRKASVFVSFYCDNAPCSFRTTIRDVNDNILLSTEPQVFSAAVQKRTVFFEIELPTAPSVVVITLELQAPPEAVGTIDFVEVRWE